MSAAERLLARLEGVRKTGPGQWMARCPAHPDRNPSLSVRETDDRLLVKCFAECPAPDVVKAVGLTLADLFEDPHYHYHPKKQRKPRIEDDPLEVDRWVLRLAAYDAEQGRDFSLADRARIELAVNRLQAARR